jgi:hypothetical protein
MRMKIEELEVKNYSKKVSQAREEALSLMKKEASANNERGVKHKGFEDMLDEVLEGQGGGAKSPLRLSK